MKLPETVHRTTTKKREENEYKSVPQSNNVCSNVPLKEHFFLNAFALVPHTHTHIVCESNGRNE